MLGLLHPEGDHPRPFPVRPGQYVCIILMGVSQAKANEWAAALNPPGPAGAPMMGAGSLILVACGLLRHEHRVSVVHYTLTKHPSYREPVQSKDTLIFHTGWRRMVCNPLFSSFAAGCKKGKYERFLRDECLSLATIYAPIQYGPAPLLVFRTDPVAQRPPGAGLPVRLVATGSLHRVDPNHIVLKRILLTGYPFKIHKRTAVIRFMFFNPDDIRWFKPVELWTKHGHSGNIKEPVGTHGYMKAVFDSPLTQADTVCMSLYKRIYPKWHTTRDLTTPTAATPLPPLPTRRKKTRNLTAKGEKTGGAPTHDGKTGYAPR